MKHYKDISAAALVLFVVVNTNFIWESWLGIFSIPVTILLFISFVTIAILTAIQLFIGVMRERLSNQARLVHSAGSTAALILVFLFPFGIIRDETLQGNDLLVASREGAAKCTTTLRLTTDGKFCERSICFGVTETSGAYKLRGDTIRFEDVCTGRNEEEYYEYAVLRGADPNQPHSHTELVRFKNESDTVGHVLWVSENHLEED